jgi:chromosome segregation ATPase
LEAAGAAAAQNEAAQKQAQARCGQLEQELSGLRQAHGEHTRKLGEAHQSTAEARAQADELQKKLQSEAAEHKAQTHEREQRIHQAVTGLAKATADLAASLIRPSK